MPTKELSVFATADYKGLSEEERNIFKSVVREMSQKGIFSRTDAPVIASYSRNVVLARLAMLEVAKYGVLIKETDNYHGEKLRENPAISILNKAQRAYEDSALRLGLTPAGRKKVGAEYKKEKSPLEEWMSNNE